ncbi:hypothetical protein MTO96_020949 [Rhipicephalus appendiculatus]
MTLPVTRLAQLCASPAAAAGQRQQPSCTREWTSKAMEGGAGSLVYAVLVSSVPRISDLRTAAARADHHCVALRVPARSQAKTKGAGQWPQLPPPPVPASAVSAVRWRSPPAPQLRTSREIGRGDLR